MHFRTQIKNLSRRKVEEKIMYTVVLPPSSKADYYAFVPRSAVC